MRINSANLLKNKYGKDLPAPDWLRFRGYTLNKTFNVVRSTVNDSKISTVCEEAKCPNRTECWSGGTATFMLMGDTCTRSCKFCSVNTALKPPPLNINEPRLLAEALKDWDLEYIVITSVDRDDLADGGSSHLAKCINIIRKSHPQIRVEILIPDFNGNKSDLKRIVNAAPDVISHNIETVRRLSPKVRDRRANYDQSLNVLYVIKELNPTSTTKSSIMLGFGENHEEIIETMQDLIEREVDYLTIGQYMRPSLKQLPVKEYIIPEKFEKYHLIGMEMGFKYVVSKPLARSSYKSGEISNYSKNK